MRRSHPSAAVRPWMGVALALILTAGLTGFILHPAPQLSPRFNHVMLYVSDLETSIEFYTTAFDLEVTQRLDELTVVSPDGDESTRPVRMAFLKFPGQEFVFELAEQPSLLEGRSPHLQHVGVDVVDIEAAAARAVAAGAEGFGGIQTVRGTGGIVVLNTFFRGPDGELLELMQMLEGEF